MKTGGFFPRRPIFSAASTVIGVQAPEAGDRALIPMQASTVDAAQAGRAVGLIVVGAGRYRNPDEDLPQDFEDRRAEYYRDLGRTEDAKAFVDELQAEMTTALRHLDAGMPHDRYVRLLWRGQNRICLSPLEPRPTPPNLEAVKSEIERRWPMTGLIDVLKEAALRTGFVEEFKTSGDRVILDPPTLRRRLLLCLYGLGTNAGLKRLSAGTEDVTYAELLHVRRRFIDRETLRAATGRVTNALLAVRDPRVWGEGTTACASDSKKFGAWNQNLMTEWHIRYGGRGVMIYWHVARQDRLHLLPAPSAAHRPKWRR